jgi:hypothetical protein
MLSRIACKDSGAEEDTAKACQPATGPWRFTCFRGVSWEFTVRARDPRKHGTRADAILFSALGQLRSPS